MERYQQEERVTSEKGQLAGDRSSPVGFCLTAVPASMLIEENDEYTTRQKDIQRIKITQPVC